MRANNIDHFDEFIRREINNTPVVINLDHWNELDRNLTVFYKQRTKLQQVKFISRLRKLLILSMVFFSMIGVWRLFSGSNHEKSIDRPITKETINVAIKNKTGENEVIQKRELNWPTESKEIQEHANPKARDIITEEEILDYSESNKMKSTESYGQINDSTTIQNTDPVKVDSLGIKKKKKKHLLW